MTREEANTVSHDLPSQRLRLEVAQAGTVVVPDGSCSYDLPHTGHTFSTRSGATLKGSMVHAESSEKAALIYQHSGDDRQQEVAAGLDATVRKARQERRPCQNRRWKTSTINVLARDT
ncbi:hypothetical protein [Streptomyces sp. S.PNR 29]|uniref:hypothetical protein n=1 Tax=Streptomyces sp. S.PNR 29 TaxID=2973805 RepID=UPI00339D3C81